MEVTDDKFGKDGMADRCSRLLMVFHSWRGLEILSAMRWELYSFLAAMIALWALRKAVRFARLGSDFHLCSSLRRAFLRSLSAGVNQGFSFGEWMTLVTSGACLSRMQVSVVL